MKIFDSTMSALETQLTLNSRRHEVLAGNIANGATPNFRARELDFAGELQKALGVDEDVVAKTNPGHMDISGNGLAHVVFDESGAVGADGNNVDLDITMGKLGANARDYDKASEFMSIKLRMLRTAVNSTSGM